MKGRLKIFLAGLLLAKVRHLLLAKARQCRAWFSSIYEIRKLSQETERLKLIGTNSGSAVGLSQSEPRTRATLLRAAGCRLPAAALRPTPDAPTARP